MITSVPGAVFWGLMVIALWFVRGLVTKAGEAAFDKLATGVQSGKAAVRNRLNHHRSDQKTDEVTAEDIVDAVDTDELGGNNDLNEFAKQLSEAQRMLEPTRFNSNYLHNWRKK